MLIKEQNDPDQGLVMTGTIRFLKSFKEIYPVFLSLELTVGLTFKNVCFQNEQLIIECCYFLFLVNL